MQNPLTSGNISVISCNPVRVVSRGIVDCLQIAPDMAGAVAGIVFEVSIFVGSEGVALAYTSNIPSSTSSPYSTILDVQTAFDRPIFPGGERRIAIPSDVPGKEIVLPDFDVLFSQITALSPLCRQLVEGERDELRPGGFADVPLGKIRPGVDAPSRGLLSWKTVEYNEMRLVFNVERLDNFLDRRAPLLRLRSRLRGEERGRGKKFSRLLTDYKLRSQWDPNCADVYEMYAPQDMADVERTMGGGLGQCIRFGVGYCRTKKNVASPTARENHEGTRPASRDYWSIREAL